MIKRFATKAVLLIGLLVGMPAWSDDRLVLVVSAASHIEQLDSLEVRKLFLGLTVTHHDNRLRPLLNEADARLKEVFLQNVVAMSNITYDRHLLGLALKQGKTQPLVFTNNVALFQALAADQNAVSFAWIKDVERDPRLKILRTLWHD